MIYVIDLAKTSPAKTSLAKTSLISSKFEHAQKRIRKTRSILHVVSCGLLGCAIDVDHFVHAKSWSLKVSTSSFYKLTLEDPWH